MNDTSPLQKELLERADSIFTSIASAASNAVEFAKAEIPDIAYQFLLFQRVYHSLILTLGIALLVVSYGLFKAGAKESAYKRENYYLSGLIVALFGFTIFIIYVKSTLLVWFAPKIYLIESMIDLAKSLH
jgi:hypothetical protein